MKHYAILRSAQSPRLAGNLSAVPDHAAGRVCCFTGHRHIEAEDQTRLQKELDTVLARLWADGYRVFWSGAALGFDLMAARAVLRLRDSHPEVRLCLAIPCATQADSWPDSLRRLWQDIRRQADTEAVLSPVYYNGCMHVRNRYMCDRSTFVISYLTEMRGGTLSTVTYAVHRGLPVLNLGVEGLAEQFVRLGPSMLSRAGAHNSGEEED